MAKARATPKVARRRASAVRPLPSGPHRFLRLVATIRKITRRRRRHRGLTAVSPSSPPPVPVSKRRQCATRPPAPSPPPPREAETPQEPKRPEEEEAHAADAAAVAVAGKYWAHRHSLFSLYDRGVRMDAEGWYSATPEAIAAAQAARAAPAGLVLDAFAGVGGNSIQFAARRVPAAPFRFRVARLLRSRTVNIVAGILCSCRGCYVVAVEIDPRKVELARHNARIYGVEDMIEFVVGDFFLLAPYLKADLVFLSPPWGGPAYNQTPVYTLDMLKPKDGHAVFQAAQKIAPNIIMFLPRNVDISQVEELSWLSSPPLDFESEESYVQHRFKGITAYFGDVAR
ncbi:trimethylguanosine synthase isoform X1 [Triticum aestivum]|nr:trimethylguanosine synthase-like isoform X1 [Triticum aestivum]